MAKQNYQTSDTQFTKVVNVPLSEMGKRLKGKEDAPLVRKLYADKKFKKHDSTFIEFFENDVEGGNFVGEMNSVTGNNPTEVEVVKYRNVMEIFYDEATVSGTLDSLNPQDLNRILELKVDKFFAKKEQSALKGSLVENGKNRRQKGILDGITPIEIKMSDWKVNPRKALKTAIVKSNFVGNTSYAIIGDDFDIELDDLLTYSTRVMKDTNGNEIDVTTAKLNTGKGTFEVTIDNCLEPNELVIFDYDKLFIYHAPDRALYSNPFEDQRNDVAGVLLRDETCIVLEDSRAVCYIKLVDETP